MMFTKKKKKTEPTHDVHEKKKKTEVAHDVHEKKKKRSRLMTRTEWSPLRPMWQVSRWSRFGDAKSASSYGDWVSKVRLIIASNE